jgi:hypothetical protein
VLIYQYHHWPGTWKNYLLFRTTIDDVLTSAEHVVDFCTDGCSTPKEYRKCMICGKLRRVRNASGLADVMKTRFDERFDTAIELLVQCVSLLTTDVAIDGRAIPGDPRWTRFSEAPIEADDLSTAVDEWTQNVIDRLASDDEPASKRARTE